MTRTALMVKARTRMLGVAFLALCLGFGWFTYAVFAKKFTDYDEVTLRTSNIGLQLPAQADVKIRGVIVGQVQRATVRTGGVDLRLGLFKSQTRSIPQNVTAEILPKTLFGEKYVSLVVPDQPAPRSLRAGDVIERSQVAIEVEQVLADIYPLLRTVQPAQLNYTLTALADALEGRGDQLGRSLQTLDGYLAQTNPQLPQLISDVRKLGEVSAVYQGVVPELSRLLRNSVVTGDTFVSQEAKIRALFGDVAALSSTSRDFLEANGDNIIRLGQIGQVTLPLMAEYSPEYPCLFKSLRHSIPRESEIFRGRKLHIVLEQLPRQPRGYQAKEAPRYGEAAGPFPYCHLLDKAVAGAYGQDNLLPPVLVRPMNDGIDYPLAKRVAPRFSGPTGGPVGQR